MTEMLKKYNGSDLGVASYWRLGWSMKRPVSDVRSRSCHIGRSYDQRKSLLRWLMLGASHMKIKDQQ